MTDSIQPNSKLCQDLSAIPEKFIVDYANTIDVLKDHAKVQRLPQSFFGRLYSGFTGQSWQRQHEINSGLVTHVEAQFKLLNELTNDVSCSLKVTHELSEKLHKLNENVSELVGFSLDTRAQIASLTSNVFDSIQQIEQRLLKVEIEANAEQHLNRVFYKWEAGKFSELSVAGRVYAVLEELNWGRYGDLLRAIDARSVDRNLEHLCDRLVAQMCKDVNIKPASRMGYREWLNPTSHNTDYQAGIEYLSCGYDVTETPFITSLQSSCVELPIAIPRICNAQRLSEALAREVLRNSL